ncbi:secretory phospholipase A2 receptor-like [Mytilus trossulus]|uniref:secretory phospholipase A2 receptor-like n=1 Tax=Mytilus trossulus TaxID=6551 RepID=UPI003005789C
MEIILFTLIALLSAAVVHTYHEPEWVTAPVQSLYSDMIRYTLYLEEKTWNDAKLICESDDAHLLSITSPEKFELIEELKLDQWGVLADKDFWAGLSQPNEGLFLWEDCTVMTFSMLKSESYNPSELCYRVKRGPVEWESKKCEDKLIFACEKKLLEFHKVNERMVPIQHV